MKTQLAQNPFAAQAFENFQKIGDILFKKLNPNEGLILNLTAENIDYLRLNQHHVRQNTHVEQVELTMKLQSNHRTLSLTFPMELNFENLLSRATQELEEARQVIALLPEDPFQTLIENHGNSFAHFPGQLLPLENFASELLAVTKINDLAGLYAGGTQIQANANHLGQFHWFSTENFFLDYSIYHGSLAVKDLFAGQIWDSKKWSEKFKESCEQLELMLRPRVKLPPNKYRAYLSPGAVAETTTMFSWNGLGQSSYKDGQSAFKKLVEKTVQLNSQFHLKENFNLGLTPSFNSIGEVSVSELPLIEKGEVVQLLTSARSAKEHQLTSNGAENSEALRSVEISPGTLTHKDILKKLGTGLYLSNLHYINWSEIENARITGMTRFACFWCENGEIVGPIEDLRFDDSFFNIFGSKLEAITDFQEIIPNVDTYSCKALGGKKLPGILVSEMNFTL